MQLINIYPIANMCMEFNQSMHMFLTHLVEKYPQYVTMARTVSGYKILDNSLIELGGAVNILRVIKAAEAIKADEIILPDVFQDGPATLVAVDRALAEIDRMYAGKCPYKLMAVAQGKDWSEWNNCFTHLAVNPLVDVIGIPKVCAKMLPGGRAEVFRRSECHLVDKPYHLLGLWYSITELAGFEDLKSIRSCDTVLGSFLAKHNLDALGVRPDGFTINLEKDIVDPKTVGYIEECFKRYVETGGTMEL